MPTRQVYLDHQSATPVLPEVMDAMRPFFSEAFGNPSSLHQQGMRAREAVAAARARVANFIHAESPDEIVFTSDGTESANLAIKGVAFANERRGNHLVVSATEHPAVLNSVEFLEKRGFACTRVKVDRAGFVDPSDVKRAMTDKTILVAVHLANHDIGTVQPIREIGHIAAKAGIAFYVDAESAAGWLPIDVRELGTNLLSFSPHRFYGPKGVGILYRNRRARLLPLLHGGSQENNWRAGIENVPAIVGAGMAAEVAKRQGNTWTAHCRKLQEQLWTGLKSKIQCVGLNGPKAGPDRSPTNLNLSVEFVEGESLVLLSDMQGIAISGSTSCVSHSLKVSPVLEAIGLPRELAQAAVTLSPGKDNTDDEIAYVIETMVAITDKLRGMSPTWSEFVKGNAGSLISK